MAITLTSRYTHYLQLPATVPAEPVLRLVNNMKKLLLFATAATHILIRSLVVFFMVVVVVVVVLYSLSLSTK